MRSEEDIRISRNQARLVVRLQPGMIYRYICYDQTIHLGFCLMVFLSFHNNSWVNVTVRQRQQMSRKLRRTITATSTKPCLLALLDQRGERGERGEGDAAEVGQ